MTGKVLFLVTLMVAGSTAQTFNPTLAVDSCTQSSLVLTTTDAADGGIIYVQGQGAACKQTTASGTFTHTIDFASCGIAWEQTFKIVIQKKALYQTGEDKQIPIMCVADLADLTVTNSLNAADKDDDAGQNKTVKPTATMALFKDGSDVGGQTVKLTDVITMILKLDDEFIQDFDIKASACSASTINVVTGFCSADVDLFPHITRVRQGELSATFGAFRTTDLNGGSVSMPFSCTLTVCLGACSATTCADSSQSYGRKKRQAEEDPSGLENINVGSSISITTDEVVIEADAEEHGICMASGLFVAIVIILVSGLVATTIVSAVMFRKLQEKSGILKKLNPGSHMTSMPIA